MWQEMGNYAEKGILEETENCRKIGSFGESRGIVGDTEDNGSKRGIIEEMDCGRGTKLSDSVDTYKIRGLVE